MPSLVGSEMCIRDSRSSERARLAPPWPLTSSHLSTASVYYLLETFPAFLCFLYFFVLRPFSHFFRFFVSSFLLFRLCLYVKPAANNKLGFFPSIRLTLSPVTGRRPDYTIFSVDIGVTDVTKNSRLFAVASTTCSTLLKCKVEFQPFNRSYSKLTFFIF